MRHAAARAAVYSEARKARQHKVCAYFQPFSALAGRAEESAPPPLDNTRDFSAALAAGLALSVINVKAVLEIAKFALSACEVP